MTSRTATRIAFGVIIVFVLAQVVWWIWFQRIYIDGVTDATMTTWQRDAETANGLVLYSSSDNMIQTLSERYPHLRFDANAEKFVVDNAQANTFINEQNGYVRMFAFEGPFFVLVVLSGLAIIARSLRTERELKRRQQNFLSAITHEFKTPMSTLRLLIETALMRTLPPEKQRDYLSRMETELTRLEQTSEQVLASARLEQSREAPVLEPLELNTVMQGIIGRARAGLETRGADLKVAYSPEPLPVSINPSAFSVVMNNLLDNAVKYSPHAHKPVTVRLEQARDLINIHVEDAGVGIPEGEAKRIFERFYRTGSEMTRETKGVGLGLHLVKGITEAMNGWVRVEANEPSGTRFTTRFTVVLPRRVSLTADEQDNIASAKLVTNSSR